MTAVDCGAHDPERVNGIEFCRKLVAEHNVHVFDSLVTGRGRSAKRDPRRKKNQSRIEGVVALTWAAGQGDLTEVRALVAAVVAAAIIARQADRKSPVQYDGRGQVYMEFGYHQVGRIDLTFAAGRPPTGTFEVPSTDLTGRKSEFVATRIQRWLGRGARHRQ